MFDLFGPMNIDPKSFPGRAVPLLRLHDFVCLRPLQPLDVHEYAHQFGSGEGGVGVVHLYRHLVGEVGPVRGAVAPPLECGHNVLIGKEMVVTRVRPVFFSNT